MTQPTLMAKLVELQEENARLREDAERYELRYETLRLLFGQTCPSETEIDAAIDAARKEQK